MRKANAASSREGAAFRNRYFEKADPSDYFKASCESRTGTEHPEPVSIRPVAT